MLHLGLWLASWPVRLGLLASLTRLAPAVRWIAGLFEAYGTDRGGMTVDAEGLDADGNPVHSSWSLLAEAGDGPFVPTLPALAAARALSDGRIFRPGAGSCAGMLRLEWIEAEFAGRRITARLRREQEQSPYERVLGHAFLSLPLPIRQFHAPGQAARTCGVARVDGADSWPANVIGALFRLPRAGEAVTVTVQTDVRQGRERWTRDFGGRRFTSELSAAAAPGCLTERFGPLAFDLALPVSGKGVLGMPVVGWRFGPVPMPRRLAPVSSVTEEVDCHGLFCFNVELGLPLGLGSLVRYRGWLVPAGDGT